MLKYESHFFSLTRVIFAFRDLRGLFDDGRRRGETVLEKFTPSFGADMIFFPFYFILGL